ncbi:PREDICTED: ubinuclein-2 isoform X2 [Nicrophorus vespilloides]|uniref:Ubinuclein-2 isoform X2 n=1 Tax=Nicrophorus vespilloides TaxID=110193 RepID=A0ABM1MBD9_NICVS|nr:PREDICTED: ubinuclein-2 isoform X2 [Nicrophorus vespilloides]
MSEIRRIALIPFGADKGDLASGSGKQKTTAPPPRTVRLTFLLPDSNEQETCPVFNYKEELAATKKKEKLKGNNANVGDRSGANELDPFDEADDDVRRIAQEMENKYGGGPSLKKKRKGRRDDYADIGMGYDESDSFIDNTDGYDEMIPQNVTTLHGGFYINSGELEFKADDEASSDVSSRSFSSSGEDEEDEAPAKRPNSKRVLESSESEGEKETENGKGAAKKIHQNKKQKTVVNGEAAQKERKLVLPDKIKQLQPHKKDENRKKDLLREKREESNIIGSNDSSKVLDAGEKDAMKENKKPTGQVNLIDVPEPPTVVDNGNKILESESRKEHVNSSKDVTPVTNCSISKDAEIVPSSEGENSADSCILEQQHEKSEAVQLPEQLPSSILELIEKLKEAAVNCSDSTKLFTTPVNTLLLSLERKCRCLGKQSKSKIYQHLGVAMKCRKETLAKRAKNLVLVEDNKRISDMILQLKVNIETTMPPLLEIYDKECVKTLQKKKENENESEKQIRMPKRKFTWSEEMKKLLRDVISTKKRCFILEAKKPMTMTKETLEAQMLSFLRTDIQILWPEGWMSMTALTKMYNQFTKSPGGGDPKVINALPRDNLKPVCLNKELQKLTQPSSTKDLKRSVSEKEVLGAKEMQKLASNSMLSIIPVDAAKMLADKTKERKNELTINKIEQSPLPIEKMGGSGLSITPAVITSKTKQQSKTDSDLKAKAEQLLKFIKPPTDHKIENIIKPSPPKTPDAECLTTTKSKPENLSKHKNEHSSKLFAESLLKSLKAEEKAKSETKSKSSDHKNSSSSSYARTKTNEHSESKPENLSRSKTLENDIIILEDTMMEPERPKNPEMKMIDLTAESSSEVKRKPGPKSKTKYYDQTTKVKSTKSSSIVNTAELDNIIASTRKEMEMLHNSKKQQQHSNKEKSHNEETASIEEVMEHLKHLNQITAPLVKTESSLTSSPVSVIAFNKNFSTKTSPMSACASSSSSSTNTATPSTNNVLPDHIKPDFGDGFQKQFYNFNSTSNATSSKNYNSGHPTLNSHSDKYFTSGNYNYTQNSKYKNYTTPAPANHKPKPPSQK